MNKNFQLVNHSEAFEQARKIASVFYQAKGDVSVNIVFWKHITCLRNSDYKLAFSLAKSHLKLAQRRKTNPFRLKVYNRGGISRAEVQERSGELSFMY